MPDVRACDDRKMSGEAHKTAPVRQALSLPAQYLMRYLSPDTTVLDYGCGRGGDVARLRELGFNVAGYDPHYAPEPPGCADVVNMAYVVNVIASPAKRMEAIRHAWMCTRKILLISVRSKNVEPLGVGWKHKGDGFLTKSGTFQKLFSDREILELVTATIMDGDIRNLGNGRIAVYRVDNARAC